ncbi:MAG: hypothetical protein ABW208_28670 [Pyrinomonadaceae bacterium]
MRNKVLYFPHMEVPQSAWLTRTLLYWDTVGVIMPYQYVEEPEKLNEHTRSLIEANLVTQVIPSDYLHEIPNFSTAFLDYVGSLGTELDRRRHQFHPDAYSHIHVQKFGYKPIHAEKLGSMPVHLDKTNDIAYGLVNLGVAKWSDYPWVNVEPQTAYEFMGYLAAVLGHHPELQFTPVTDKSLNLVKLVAAEKRRARMDEQLNYLRLQVLEDVLPVPTVPLRVRDVEDFKRRHGEQLSRFRRTIEAELTVLADIQDADLRERRLELFIEGAREEIQDIQSKMIDNRWSRVVYGKLCALLGKVPVVGFVPDIINTVYNAFGNSPVNPNTPFAYAAYAQRELLGQR